MNEPNVTLTARVVLHDDDDDLEATLRKAQMLLVQHPIAAQALFHAFVTEGRAFAKTKEGRLLRDELSASDLIRRGRVVWEVGTLNLLEENENTLLPSKLLDAIVYTAGVESLEPLLSKLFESVEKGAMPSDR